MSSASERSDYTARARIRNAAIRLFAANGYAKASIRQIADNAGTSAGLVIHHFGSKEELKKECDEYVVTLIMEDKIQFGLMPTVDSARMVLDSLDDYRPLLEYLGRMLTEPGSAGDELFDHILRATTTGIANQMELGIVRPLKDVETTSLLLTVFGLAPLLLRDRLERALGADFMGPEGAAKLAIPMIEMFTNGLYVNEDQQVIIEEALAEKSHEASTKGRNDDNG